MALQTKSLDSLPAHVLGDCGISRVCLRVQMGECGSSIKCLEWSAINVQSTYRSIILRDHLTLQSIFLPKCGSLQRIPTYEPRIFVLLLSSANTL